MATLAACATACGSNESFILGPRGYAITISGIPHSEHCLETMPRSSSI